MEKKMTGGYIAPEIEILTIAVEQGYSVSSTIGDWEDGENVAGEV